MACRPMLQVVSAVDPFGSYASEVEAGLNDAFVNDAFQHPGSGEGLPPGTPLSSTSRGTPPFAGGAVAPSGTSAVAAESVSPAELVGGASPKAAAAEAASADAPSADAPSADGPPATTAETPADGVEQGTETSAAAGGEDCSQAEAPTANGDAKPQLQVPQPYNQYTPTILP